MSIFAARPDTDEIPLDLLPSLPKAADEVGFRWSCHIFSLFSVHLRTNKSALQVPPMYDLSDYQHQFLHLWFVACLQDAPPNHAAHVAVKWEAPKRVWTSGAQRWICFETLPVAHFKSWCLGVRHGDIFVGKFVKIFTIFTLNGCSFILWRHDLFVSHVFFSHLWGRMSIFQSCLFGQGFFLLQWCSLPSGQSS